MENTTIKKKFLVFDISGTMTAIGDYQRFHFEVPKGYNVREIALFSPELYNRPYDREDQSNVLLSLSLNNRKKLQNLTFELQNHENETDPGSHRKTWEVNEMLDGSICGYVKNMRLVRKWVTTPPPPHFAQIPFSVQLILICYV